MRLHNKTAVITGSSRGIGAGIASALADEGARVVITYRERRDCADQVADAIRTKGGQALVIQLDVSVRASVKAMIEQVHSSYGAIDILVNNAAVLQQKDFMQITDEEWETMFRINIQGIFICTQEVLREMLIRKSGKIINISSIGGQWGGQLAVHYAATKAAIINFTQSMAKLYSSSNIQTNCISPGLVETEMSRAELETPAGKEKVRSIPAQRLGTVKDIARAAVFLASEESSYITGQTLNLNGGMFFRS